MTTTNQNTSKKAFDFFKVDDKFFTTYGAISKKAVLLYLLMCRRINNKKNQGCIFTGKTDAKKSLGLNQQAYDMAFKELIDNHFITERRDIGTRFFKDSAKEILAFPTYHKGLFARGFSSYKTVGDGGAPQNIIDNHRRTTCGKFFNVPCRLIDGGLLKAIKADAAAGAGFPLNEIYSLLWIYANLTWENGGFDYTKAYMKPEKITLNAGRSIVSNKSIYSIEDKSVFFTLDALNGLHDKGLWGFTYCVFDTDKEDKDIKRYRRDLFSLSFKDYKEHQAALLDFEFDSKTAVIIGVIRPKIPLMTESYKAFLERSLSSTQDANALYKQVKLSGKHAAARLLNIETS